MTIVLPQITVQHDFQTVISEVQEGIISEESFWVSCYKQENSSVHGRVNVCRAPGQVQLTPEAVEFERSPHSVYSASCPSLAIPPTRLRVPRQIAAFDVAPDASLYATGDGDGNLRVSSTSGSGKILTSKPHKSTILSLRFFPSSKVILTSSNDFALSIISATDLSVPRTLKAHTRAVTDSAIISKGRNVISCSKDGTIRLWDVASGTQIRVFGSTNYSPVYKMSLGIKDGDMDLVPPDGEILQSPSVPVDGREVETTDKIVFCALHNGSFEGIDLGTKSAFFRSEPPETLKTPLESMALTDHILATGSRAGVVTIYDTRQLSDPLFSFQRNGASVEEMAFVPTTDAEVRLAIASADGLPYVASIIPEGPEVVEELVGYNYDAVRCVKVTNGSIWTTGDDGLIRRY
ncbi:WD40-repeat-containing domain protein [Hysterangium stoloniferum]|nr:WD40-repeat-containing domain protein [Hysterangium stoloniferum]